jgi:hypothetical protein
MDTNSQIYEIFEKINQIKDNTEMYNTVKKHFKDYKFKTIMEMQNEYLKKYKQNGNQKNEIVNLTKINELVKNIDYLKSKIECYEEDIKNKSQYIMNLESYKEENNKKEKYIQELENEESKKEKYIECLENEGVKKGEYIVTLENANTQKDKEIIELNEIIKVKDNQIQIYENMRAVKLVKKLRRKK